MASEWGCNSVGCPWQPMWAPFCAVNCKPGTSLGNTSVLPEPTWTCGKEGGGNGERSSMVESNSYGISQTGLQILA